MTFRPLDGPWGYAYEAIEHIEARNCALGTGCISGAAPGSATWRDVGPGGYCGLLATIALGDPDTVLDEMSMTADGRVVCHAHEARPAPRPEPEPIPEGQLTIEDR